MAGDGVRRLDADQVRLRFDLSERHAGGIASLSPSPGTVGQPEALQALETGLAMEARGFNVFLSGHMGTGRFAAVREALERRKVPRPRASGYAFVHDFRHPRVPLLVRFEPGLGRRLEDALDSLRETLGEEVPGVLAGEVLARTRQRLISDYETEARGLFQDIERRAQELGFQVVHGASPRGEAYSAEVFPVVDGEPVPLERVLAPGNGTSSGEGRSQEILETHRELAAELRAVLSRHRAVRTRYHRMLEEAERRAVKENLDTVLELYNEELLGFGDAVRAYLEGLEEVILKNLHLFRETGDPHQGRPWEGLLGMVRANVVADPCAGEESGTCPVVEEAYPTYSNLFGSIDAGSDPASASFMDIKAGSVLAADGGVLILNARDLVEEPRAYPTLKRVLRRGLLEIAPREDQQPTGVPLKPVPIPVDVKTVLVGEPEVYEALYARDPDFRKIFKVKSEFDDNMPLTGEAVEAYLSVLRRIQKDGGLKDFDREALEVLLETGVRMAGNRNRLTTVFSDLADLMREADQLAGTEGHKQVGRGIMARTVRRRDGRHGLVERQMLDLIRTGKILIDVTGSRVGQVNGLAYYRLEDAAFALPARISATTATGRAGVVNVERESELSGSIHDKGVLIITGFLMTRFAQDKPLALHANIAFEQSYATVDGDSASLAELLALVSALSGHALRQDLAVTGSLNQRGRVQPVGGVTEKCEGFFRACRAAGALSGTQGVVIPEGSAEDLQLDEPTTEAVREGSFAIYAASSFEDALELMTGRPAPSTMAAADRKLAAYAGVMGGFR